MGDLGIRQRSLLPELGALVWIAVLAGAFLAPALAHGASLGPYDVLKELGLTSQANPQIHNAVGSDEIEQFIPWQILDWKAVHAGQLPLWNPYSLLGMPLAFNFEAAPFGLTVAIGYAFPLHLAHTATIVARLLVAGSGTYVFARLLGLDRLAALFGASVFELCGAFTIWLGVYQAGCLCYTGWVLAAATYVLRGRRRAVGVALFAVSLALALLEGEPQIAVLLVLFVSIYVLVVLVSRWRSGERGEAKKGLLAYALGVLAAAGLASPVYLPGIQLALSSARDSGPFVSGLPVSDLTHLLFSDYNGVPTALNEVIGPDNLYVSMIYVGTIVLVLGLVALVSLRKRPEVIAFTLLAALLTIILFFGPIVTLMRTLAELKVFRIDLATTLLDFALAMLAAFGVQALLKGPRRLVDRALLGGTLIAAVILLVLGIRLALNADHLPTGEQDLRASSFLWPALSCGACVVVLGARRLFARGSGRTGACFSRRSLPYASVVLLLGVEVAFLLVGGSNFVSSSPSFLPKDRAITTLSKIVGSSLVGIGSCTENAFPNAGILANVNAAYGIDELTAYDPIIPKAYYTAYGKAAHRSTAVLFPHVLCPAITSVALARELGVSYILEPPGVSGAPGTRLVATIHGEGLYRVPGSGRATIVPLREGGPPRVVPAFQPGPSSWRVRFDAATASRLELRVTAVPGWHASLDGKPLPLSGDQQVMLTAEVPPGRHVVTLSYRPALFDLGLLLAVLTLALLVASTARAVRVNRHRSGRGALS